MKLIRPETVTDSIFQSSDVPETDYSAWAGGTTYADGDRVIVTTGVHKIYESQQAATNRSWAATSATIRQLTTAHGGLKSLALIAGSYSMASFKSRQYKLAAWSTFYSRQQ